MGDFNGYINNTSKKVESSVEHLPKIDKCKLANF